MDVPGFFPCGWPWWYIGGHQDPRLNGKHPELKDKAGVPDVLLQPHNASLQLTFHQGDQFPAEYKRDIRIRARHLEQSGPRGVQSNSCAVASKADAMASMKISSPASCSPDGNVRGRPVGITVTADGALLVSDDGSNSIWRVSYSRK
jgi:glucose/arabinose dehydrogenase